MKKTKEQLNISLWRFLKDDKKLFVILAITGIIFNVGLVFIPVFEGWLVQCLFDIIGENKVLMDMVRLVAFYLVTMIIVQTTRYLKRVYVRKIANNMVVRMRDSLYLGILSKVKGQVGSDVGELVTRASLDVEIVAEGTRKTLTEIFDTGVLLIAFSITMFLYDPIIALIALTFTPIACIIAELLKKVIFASVTAYKVSGERLSNQTYDRVTNESLYRVYARDSGKNAEYKRCVDEYSNKAIKASIWENTLQPIYNVIAMIGVIFIIYLGGRNYLGIGFRVWDIAIFTTFISCYAKVADKASKVAKLFNSVQKAKVSWERLKKNLSKGEVVFAEFSQNGFCEKSVYMTVNDMSYGYKDNEYIIKNASFSARGGQIIGVTGAVASGKSTFGKAFLGESDYGGSIAICDKELRDMNFDEIYSYISYLGHNCELFSDSIRENILMGTNADPLEYLKIVCLDEEVAQMENGLETMVGSNGLRLSGGQMARVALARTLVHAKSILILDDPFSAVDKKVEAQILKSLREKFANRLIILISHRLSAFPSFDKVLWIEDGFVTESTHSELMKTNEKYRQLYELQSEVQND